MTFIGFLTTMTAICICDTDKRNLVFTDTKATE